MARLIFAGLALALAMGAVPAEAKRKPKPAAAPVPPPPSVKQAVELWRMGDYAGAVAMWQPFADAGDADAMFNIGQAYKLGRSVPKDSLIARDWYRKAAAKGHLPAEANLGILLFQAGDKAEAIRWLKMAADRNELRAQYVLGVAMWNGDGTPRNLALAYAYLTRAAAQGLPDATSALNSLTGVIGPVDRANGWAASTSLAAGKGLPANLTGNTPPVVYAGANERFNRDDVMKPAPKPEVVAAAMPVTPNPAPPPSVAPPAVAVVMPPPVVVPKPVVVAAAPPVPKPVVVTVTPSVPKPVVVAAAPPVPKPAPVTATPVTPPPKPVVVAVVPVAAPPKPAERPIAPPVTTVAIPAAAPAKPIETAVAKPTPPKIETATAEPAPKPKPSGWRVQLGAFSERQKAEAAWTDVKTKQKTLVANAKPIYEASGNVTKLQIGPYPTKTAARDACAKIAFSGRACFVTEG